MKLSTILMVIPFIFLLIACPPVVTDDDDSSGDDDDSALDDDDSAVTMIFMDEVRIIIERNCDNQRDDDQDGIADCGDSDCEFAPDCVGY